MSELRLTLAVVQVLRAFLEDAAEPRYGYDLMRQTGFPSGKLYPILSRLHRAGWLLRENEAVDPAVAGRPARVVYRLSPAGAAAAGAELIRLAEQLRPPLPATPRLRPHGGTA